MFQQVKSLYASKTFWLAAVQALVGVIAVFATAYPDVGALIIVKCLADIYLRTITTTPVTANPLG